MASSLASPRSRDIDGALLGLPVALVAIRDVLHSRNRASFLAGLAVRRWHFCWSLRHGRIRQLATFGSVAPSAVSGRALWLTDYQQLFSVAQSPTVDQWLNQGMGWILSSRIGGLLAALGLFALLPLAAVLAPFAAIGAWHERRNVAFVPFLIYGAAL